MVFPSLNRGRRGAEDGQGLAEVAIVAPVALLLVFGTLQLAFIGYGVAMARYAAFVSMRRAAVRPAAARETTARSTAAALLAGTPGIRFVGTSMHRAKLPLRGVAHSGSMERWTLTVRVRVPRLIPLPRGLDCSLVGGTASMPEEPRW